MTGRLIACVTLVALLEPALLIAQAPPRRGIGIGALAGRQVVRPLQVRSCDEARSAVGNLRLAPPTLIDFEDVGGRGQTDVTTQYASRGVIFNGPTLLDLSAGADGPGFAHSPSHGIQQCWAKEFCDVPIDIVFAEPQARVQLWVGYAGRAQGPGEIRLEILDAAGKSIDRCGVTIAPANTPQRIALPLELTTASNAISKARVSAPVLGIVGVAADDLQYQRLAPPVPDLVVRSARVDLSSGGQGRIRIVVVVNDAPSPATTLTVNSPAWGTLSADVRALDPAEEGAEIDVLLPANLAGGRHEYTVRVASPQGVAESNTDNNVLMGEIDVPASSSSSVAQPRAPINPPPVEPGPGGGGGGGKTLVLWVIGAVLVLASLGFLIGRTGTTKPPSTAQSKRAHPSADRIHVTPNTDAGLQRIRPARGLPAFVVRVRPVAGPSSIHAQRRSPGE